MTPFNVSIIVGGLRKLGNASPGFLFRKYFTVVGSDSMNMRTMGQDIYITRDPLVIKHFLTGKNFYNYGKGPGFQSAFYKFLGTGIFNSDPNETWSFHRQLTKPFFSKERVTDFKLDNIDKMIKYIKIVTKGDTPIDIQDCFSRLTFDSATDFLFSYQPNSLDEMVDGEGPGGEISRAFSKVTHLSMKYWIMGMTNVRQLHELLFGDARDEPMKKINTLVERIVHNALERQSQQSMESRNSKEHECVLDYLLTQTQDSKLVCDELLNLLLAGRDTTYSLLTSLFIELARNPELYKRTRDECLNLFGEDGEPDYTVMRNSKFLRALLNETLRLYPPVPLNHRYAFKEDVVTTSDGRRLYIPSNTLFAYDLWGLHRNVETWGEDAGDFDPERFLDHRLEKMTSNPFIFQPFSAGPRLCLGQQHAYNQLTLTVIRMCQAFEKVELATDVQESILPVASVTLNWKNGAYLRLYHAQQ